MQTGIGMTGEHNSNSSRGDLGVDGGREVRRRDGARGAVRRGVGGLFDGGVVGLQGRDALSSEWQAGHNT